ncbi:MAG: Lrp/AsnC family transcriptional regulator [Ectothiorhodospiraceae bacterium]
MHTVKLDAYDRRLLSAIQNDGRLSNAQLAEQVHLSPSQCQRRVKKLEELGVLQRFVGLVNRHRIGLGVMAFVNVSLEKHGRDPAQRLQETIDGYPQVLECWAVSGESDYLLRVVAPNLEAFSNFLLHELLGLPMVSSVKSNILLRELKSTTALPLEGLKD